MSVRTPNAHKSMESSRRDFQGKPTLDRFRASRGGSTTGKCTDDWIRTEECDSYRPRGPLNDDQRELAARYLPMASALAKRMNDIVPGESEELESTAYLALVEAAQMFDPSMSVNFATYARYRIYGALRDFRRRRLGGSRSSDKTCLPVFQRLGNDVERHGQVIGINPGWPVGTEIEATDAVEDWLRRLPRAHGAVCRLIYIDGKSQDEAAGIVGRSKSFVSRLHQEAIRWVIDDIRLARAARHLDVANESA